ncbi:hypothetical protein HY439_01800 [Candidatus Microgenomates bacterium]|nr:hypothetical protein [Candidatus Microgenomates bacterium]
MSEPGASEQGFFGKIKGKIGGWFQEHPKATKTAEIVGKGGVALGTGVAAAHGVDQLNQKFIQPYFPPKQDTPAIVEAAKTSSDQALSDFTKKGIVPGGVAGIIKPPPIPHTETTASQRVDNSTALTDAEMKIYLTRYDDLQKYLDCELGSGYCWRQEDSHLKDKNLKPENFGTPSRSGTVTYSGGLKVRYAPGRNLGGGYEAPWEEWKSSKAIVEWEREVWVTDAEGKSVIEKWGVEYSPVKPGGPSVYKFFLLEANGEKFVEPLVPPSPPTQLAQNQLQSGV